MQRLRSPNCDIGVSQGKVIKVFGETREGSYAWRARGIGIPGWKKIQCACMTDFSRLSFQFNNDAMEGVRGRGIADAGM